MAKVLLVEGNDDVHVFRRVCNVYADAEIIEVKQLGDVESILQKFPVHLKQSGLVALGLLVDADRKPEARWTSFRNRAGKLGYNLPRKRGAGYVSNEADLPRLGIWIMPDNKSTGNLESFVWQLIPEEDDLAAFVVETVYAIPIARRRFKDAYRTKALCHTWLAWQRDPGTPIGLGFRKGYFRQDHELCQSFAAWAARLYG